MYTLNAYFVFGSNFELFLQNPPQLICLHQILFCLQQASSGEPPSPVCGGQLAPPPPSGGPDKVEAQIEGRDAHITHHPASLSSAMPGLEVSGCVLGRLRI